jgi:hypothetical protein
MLASGAAEHEYVWASLMEFLTFFLDILVNMEPEVTVEVPFTTVEFEVVTVVGEVVVDEDDTGVVEEFDEVRVVIALLLSSTNLVVF